MISYEFNDISVSNNAIYSQCKNSAICKFEYNTLSGKSYIDAFFCNAEYQLQINFPSCIRCLIQMQLCMVKCTGAHYRYSQWGGNHAEHYGDVIMSAMVSEITSLMIVYWTVYSGADQRKHQSSALLAFVRGIHRWPVNSPHKWPVTRKMLSFDDVIMNIEFVLAKLLCHRAMNGVCICVCCFILRRIYLLCNISRFE